DGAGGEQRQAAQSDEDAGGDRRKIGFAEALFVYRRAAFRNTPRIAAELGGIGDVAALRAGFNFGERNRRAGGREHDAADRTDLLFAHPPERRSGALRPYDYRTGAG